MQQLPYSLEIEKYCLAALLKCPQIIPDYAQYLVPDIFYGEINAILWGAIKSQYYCENTVERVTLVQNLINIGIKEKNNVSIPDYVDALYSLHNVNEDSFDKYFKELYKYSIARKIVVNCHKLEKDIYGSLHEPVDVIISKADVGLANCVSAHIEDDYNPRDLFQFSETYIEGVGEEPAEDGIPTPFPRFTKMYGSLLQGDLVVVAAPAGKGKSTFVNYIAKYAVQNSDKKVKALILDTELETERVTRRMVANESGVGEYYLRTGKWRLNEEMTVSVRKALKKLKNQAGLEHLYVANRTIDEIVSIVRRWAAKYKNDPDIKLMIVYDYLKLTGEKISDSWKEYQVMGAKCDTLKRLCSEVNAAGLTAVQTNASNDVAMAQQIKWFASNVYILNPKTPQEITEHGKGYGTHKLTAIKTRNQGEEAQGFSEYVQVVDSQGKGKYEQNFINLHFENFGIEEKGTFQDIIDHHMGGTNPKPKGRRRASDDDDDDPI
jgi:replicative DNA helicase